MQMRVALKSIVDNVRIAHDMLPLADDEIVPGPWICFCLFFIHQSTQLMSPKVYSGY